MSETAFEKWWLDQHGPNWQANLAIWEKEDCEVTWNAAIDAAMKSCEQVESRHDAFELYPPDEIAEECKDEIQKLRGE